MHNQMDGTSNFIHKKLYCTVGDIQICGILDAGFFFTNRFTYEPHMHLQHEFHIVSRGQYVIENLDGTESITLRPGMVALIPPRYYHNTVHLDVGDADKFSFRMEYEKVKRSETDNDGYYALLDSYLKEKESEDKITVFKFEKAMDNIVSVGEYMSRDDVGDKAMATAYFKLFMTEVVVEMIKNVTRSEGNKIMIETDDSVTRRKDIINYTMSTNYSNPKFNIGDFAEGLNLSERQANRVAIKLYGMTFHQLLTQIRLNSAIKLLKRTNLSIKNISEMVGYESSTGFFLAFKNKFGITPGEYRNSNDT